MPTLKINDTLSINVDENFRNLSKAEQDRIVDEAVTQDAISGTGKAFASGLMFNFRDEIVSALSEPTSAIASFMGDEQGGRDYKLELSRQRALEEAFRAQNPATAISAEIAGGLIAPGGVLGTVAKAPTIAARVGKGMLAGGAMGGLSGAGMGEEGQRLQSAATGAAVGGVAAPIAMGVAPTLKAVGGGTARVAKGLGEMAIKTPQDRAAKIVARRLKQAGVTGEALEALKRSPKPETIADIDSSGISSLARLVAQSPYKGAELARSLNARQFGTDKIKSASERIEKDLLDAGVPVQSAREAKVGLDAIKRESTSPLYKQAHEVEVPQSFRDAVRPLFDRPAVRSSVPAAKRLAANSGDPITGDTVDSLDFKGFDYLQRSLNAMATKAFKAGDAETGNAIKAIRTEIVDQMKSVNKPFKEAFDTYGDVMSNERALEAGRKFLNLRDPNQIKDLLSGMSEAEKHNFRVGAAQTIRNAIESAADGRNMADVIAKSKKQLRQLQEAFPEGGFAKLEKALDVERTMARKRNEILGGSQTFKTSAESVGVAAADRAMTEKIIRGGREGGVLGAALGAVGDVARPAMMGIGPRTSKALGDILFETDPIRRGAAINRLQRVGNIPRQAPLPPSRLSQMGTSALQGLPSFMTRGLLFDAPISVSNELLLGD